MSLCQTLWYPLITIVSATHTDQDDELSPAMWQLVMEQDTSPWNTMLCFAIEHSKSAAALKRLAAAQKKHPRPATYQQLAEAAATQRYRQCRELCIYILFRSKRPLTPPVSPSKRARATKQKETDQEDGKAVAEAIPDAPSANIDGDPPSESESESKSKGDGNSVSSAHSITSKSSAQGKDNGKRKHVEPTPVDDSGEEQNDAPKVLNQLFL